MDPQVTFDELVVAADAGDLEAAQQHAQSLIDWFDRGGFAPSFRVLGMQRSERVLVIANGSIVYAICEDILSREATEGPDDAP